jgi:23S rRNA (cytidine1920-2'-O)/16S rRNA (cytidine1409-2'-O)-methyltransferase
MRSRLDLEIARRGLAESREAAQRLIMAGRVRVNSRPAAKADLRVDSDAPIAIIAGAKEYASRGAYKLIAALDHFAIDATGRCALDVGASTGGFSDILLRRGAAKVIALDVGYGQLAEALRVDPRVIVIDRTNIRYVRPDDLPYRPNLVTIDVSFISLKLVLPALMPLLAKPADLIALIKPQFEAGRGQVGKGGVVRDGSMRARTVSDVIDRARNIGFECTGHLESPITGAAGNREYLAHLVYS